MDVSDQETTAFSNARAYAQAGFRIFPVYEVRDGKCACGNANCRSPAKHPRTRNGCKDATTDLAQIERWWRHSPGANIGIATGGGLVVIDVDGPEGEAALQALQGEQGPLPETATAKTSRGRHLYFRTPKDIHIPCSARDGLDVRGDGGFVVAPFSRHISGHVYEWIGRTTPADAPAWLLHWAKNRKGASRPIDDKMSGLGELPAYLQNIASPEISDHLAASLKIAYSPAEHARLVSALAVIPADSYDTWYRVGMGLKDLDWQRSDGSDLGFELFDTWSQASSEKYSLAGCENKWRTFKRSGVSVGTIYHMAKQHGWTEGGSAPLSIPLDNDPGSGMNGQSIASIFENHAQAVPVASLFALRWHGQEDLNAKRGWLVKQLLPKTGAGLISGQWGTAKTFVAIDLAVAVMTGNSFANRTVRRKGGVLFIAAEGASEVPIRLAGVVETKYPDHQSKLPFAWAEFCPPLTEPNATATLGSIAKQAADRMRTEFNEDLVLIVIDTMAAAAGFTDENSSAEGQKAMNVLNELSRYTGALVLACDHFGKLADTGTRGTSAKEASADVVIACLGDRSIAGSLSNSRIAVRKLRGGATGAQTAFSLRMVDMGVDEDYEAVTTCVIDWSAVTVPPPPLEKDKKSGWPKGATLFRECLMTVLQTHGRELAPIPNGPTLQAVELEAVHREFNERYPLDGDDDRQKQINRRRQVFKRSREDAVARKLVSGREIDGKFMIWLMTPPGPGLPMET
jgi:bifunctional DNA primase/polymerase-like protein/AAA domain-containing protein/primase-like protein